MTDWHDAGCARDCSEQHTYEYGRCALGKPPEPTVSMSVIYTDGGKSIGFDTYTVQQLADLITPALCTGDAGWTIPFDQRAGRTVALRVAQAIVHRNAEPAPGPDTTSPAAGLPGWIRNGVRGSRIPHITAHPVTPEMERAATERAIQAAADNERAREWIAAHSGRTPAEQQRDQLAALAREILYATHNISSQDWARWRETLDTITDQEQ